MSWLETFARCECGHIRGDHKTARSPLGRPVAVGACRVEECACREFKAAVAEQREKAA